MSFTLGFGRNDLDRSNFSKDWVFPSSKLCGAGALAREKPHLCNLTSDL